MRDQNKRVFRAKTAGRELLSTIQNQSLDVILEIQLSRENDSYQIFYSNKQHPNAPSRVRRTGAVTVHETDGSIGRGPLHVIRVTLQPLEVQILGR